MVFASTEKLRSYLEKQRAHRSLHSIQREEFPRAKVGTLSRIINDAAYNPIKKDVRKQLRLAEICPSCKRRMPKQKQQKQASALLPHDLWWRSLSPAARQEIIKSMYQAAGAF